MSAVRAVRAYGTAAKKGKAAKKHAIAAEKKERPFLSDAIAKAAIGKHSDVAESFVSAFAPLVHQQQGMQVREVVHVPVATSLTLGREMKNDIAFRYKTVGGGAETATLEVVPHSRALVDIQLRSEEYLPGRSLAHACGHYLAALDTSVRELKGARAKAKKANSSAGEQVPPPSLLQSKPKGVFKYDMDNAYVNAEPVHLLMLSDFCYAHDTAGKEWRATKSSEVLASGRYGWASPLFSTFCLTTNSGNVRLGAGLEDPGLNTFASFLKQRLSITIVHLPLVPSALSDTAAWSNVMTLPEHKEALKSLELRQWLHYLAHTSLNEGAVEIPEELQKNSIFVKSAEAAGDLLGSTESFSYSEKEVVDITLKMERVAEEAAEAAAAAARDEERAAGAVRETALRAAAADAAANARAAAAREAALWVELEHLKRSGSGAP